MDYGQEHDEMTFFGRGTRNRIRLIWRGLKMTKIDGVLKEFDELCGFHRKLRACDPKEKSNKSPKENEARDRCTP